MNREQIKMIKWQAERPKDDILKSSVLFNLLRTDAINIKRLGSAPPEKLGSLRRAVRKRKLMEFTGSSVIHCQERPRAHLVQHLCLELGKKRRVLGALCGPAL